MNEGGKRVETDSLIWTVHRPLEVAQPELEAVEGQIANLLEQAREAALRAYAPYSKFRVGTALCAENSEGTVGEFIGNNIENASYGATMCAERVAIFNSVSAGFTQFRWVVLTTLDSIDEPDLAQRSPCGLCRQVMSEFFDEKTWLLIDGGRVEDRNRIDLTTIDLLLPWRFRL